MWLSQLNIISSPNGDIDVSAGSAVTTAAPVPTDAQPETNTRCGQWDEVWDTLNVLFEHDTHSLSGPRRR